MLRSAHLLEVQIDDEGAEEMARRSRGTPRIANRLLRRVRDYAQVRAGGHVDLEVARRALDLLEVDRFGLDEIDQKIMLTMLEKYDGGPVGLNTIAASIDEEPDTIEEVYEPYLMQLGFLDRTPRGRVATDRAFDYFKVPRRARGHCRIRCFENRLSRPRLESRRPAGAFEATPRARLQAPDLLITRASSIYETEPRDFLHQPWFLNQVIEARDHAVPAPASSPRAKDRARAGPHANCGQGPASHRH